MLKKENKQIVDELQNKAKEIDFRFVIDQEMPNVRRMWVTDNLTSNTVFKFANLDNDNNITQWNVKDVEAFEKYYDNVKQFTDISNKEEKTYKAVVVNNIQYVGMMPGQEDDYAEPDDEIEEFFKTPQEALEFIRDTAKSECLCGRLITAELNGSSVLGYGIEVTDNSNEAYDDIDARVNNYYTRHNIPKVKITREIVQEQKNSQFGADQINWKTPDKTYVNKFLYEKADDIPYAIINRKQWCCWRSEWSPSGKTVVDEHGNKTLAMLKDENGNLVTDKDGNPIPDGKWIKIPYSPKVSRDGKPYRAKSNDPKTWGSYQDCCRAIREHGHDGLGIMLGRGIIGIDLDHIRNEQGEFNEKTKNIIADATTYTEYSPSRTGVHLLMLGHLPEEFNGKGKKVILNEQTKEAIEFYSDKRFFTFTGDVVEGVTKRMLNSAEGTLKVNEIFEKYIDEKDRRQATGERIQVSWNEVEGSRIIEDNDELIHKMIAAGERDKNKKTLIRGGKEIPNEYYGINVPFELFYGNFEKITSDHSAADYKLIGKIWYYTNSPKQVDEIMRKSVLMRDKWDRPTNFSTYGQETIENYINLHQDASKYNPNWCNQKLEQQKADKDKARIQKQMEKEAARAAKASKEMEM